MAWETDQPPINYLKRRIIYYKKKRGSFRTMREDESYFKQYGGKKEFQKLVDRRIYWTEQRIKEFEKAVSILENGTK